MCISVILMTMFYLVYLPSAFRNVKNYVWIFARLGMIFSIVKMELCVMIVGYLEKTIWLINPFVSLIKMCQLTYLEYCQMNAGQSCID